MVADTAPAELREPRSGVFNLLSGIALLLASIIAGVLWGCDRTKRTFSPAR